MLSLILFLCLGQEPRPTIVGDFRDLPFQKRIDPDIDPNVFVIYDRESINYFGWLTAFEFEYASWMNYPKIDSVVDKHPGLRRGAWMMIYRYKYPSIVKVIHNRDDEIFKLAEVSSLRGFAPKFTSGEDWVGRFLCDDRLIVYKGLKSRYYKTRAACEEKATHRFCDWSLIAWLRTSNDAELVGVADRLMEFWDKEFLDGKQYP